MVSFNEIPSDVRTPGQFLEINNARAPSSPAQHVALVIGQRLAAGTVAEAVPTLVPNASAGETYFGIGSHIAEMLRVFKAVNPYTEVWAIAVDDDGGSTARQVTLSVTGPATAGGTIYLYIGGRRVTVSVASGDAATVIATAINTAIQGHTDYARMPFSSEVATNVVTLTARNAGTVANQVDVRLNYLQGESLPAGVGVAIAQSVAGAVDPSVTTATDVIGDVQYHTIATSLNDTTNVAALVTFLESRWDAMVEKDGQAFVGTQGNLSTLQTYGGNFNSFVLTAFETGGLAANSPTPPYLAAANVAAVDAHQTNLDPARPRQTLELSQVLPPAAGDQFSREERDTLLRNGIATHRVVQGKVQIERLITTYQTSPAGAPDTSYMDITRPRTLAYLRYDLRTYLQNKYPRHKLADDGTLFDPGQAVVTPNTIKSEILSRARVWERAALIENLEQFKTDLIVERDATDKERINYVLAPDLVNGFRVGAGQIQFIP